MANYEGTALMRVLGVKATKDSLDWAIVEGTCREDAGLIEQDKASVPVGLERGDELAWVRREIRVLLERHDLDAVGLRATEPGGRKISVPRAEVDGVVMEACASMKVACSRLVAATIRSRFKAKNKEELEAALTELPALAGVAASRRDPVVTALALADRDDD